jgi:hypothetical protein
MPNFPNLPKTQINRRDGGLKVSTTDANPKVMLLGVAVKGPGDVAFDARDLGAARQLFGQTSELYKGLVETKKAYGEAANIHLYRIGTEPAVLQIGNAATSSGVLSIHIQERTATVGADWKASYNNTSGYLWVYNELGTLVFSNSPNNIVDLGEVEIRGSFAVTSGREFGDITGGSLATSVTLTDAGLESTNSFTAAVTGGEITASGNLKQRYEALQDAYRLLETEQLDIVVPLGTYIDDPNVAHFTSGVDVWTSTNNPHIWQSGTLSWFKETAPAEGSATGRYAYAWSDDVIISDAARGNWATGALRIAADYHEVNFAHQLANFCFQQTKNETTCFGVIGVLPPVSYGLADIHAWVGKKPVKSVAGAITANGFGLLGLPEIGGSTSVKLNPLTHDDLTGRDPGFFATASEFLDAVALNDDGDFPVDIGAYLNVVGEWPLHLNTNGSVVGYSQSAAAYYAGLIGRLDEKNAPTNELALGLRVPYRAGKTRWDDLTLAHIVMMAQRPEGAFVIDAPTFAREASDFRRLTTVRLVGLAEDVVRLVAQRYIGKASNAITKAAFKGEIEEELQKLTKRGYLKRFEFTVTTSLLQDILGQAHVKMLLVVPNELRQVFATVQLGVE